MASPNNFEVDLEETLFGKLVEVETPEENTFLTNIAKQERIDIRLGMIDAFVEGKWVYLSSLKALTFTNWSWGNPDNLFNQDCATLASYKKYKWDDEDCTEQRNFVCERLIGSGS
ncbi:perlucin-like protein [Saccostrea cucullata]|uniref:perlucin-like protein n=1 Tax=Saccostrea cuccullata TaxID=36930 RepID=UPI002ED53490